MEPSEKYFIKNLTDSSQGKIMNETAIKTYGEICELEGQIKVFKSALAIISDPKAKSIISTSLMAFREELLEISVKENL